MDIQTKFDVGDNVFAVRKAESAWAMFRGKVKVITINIKVTDEPPRTEYNILTPCGKVFYNMPDTALFTVHGDALEYYNSMYAAENKDARELV